MEESPLFSADENTLAVLDRKGGNGDEQVLEELRIPPHPLDTRERDSHNGAPKLLTRSFAMAITRLIVGNGKERKESTETVAANEYFEQYLRENTEASEVMLSMQDIIDEFKKRSPRMVKSKCIDGRGHGSKAIGRPQKTVRFLRSDGVKGDLSFSNTTFWNRINREVLDAKRHTPGMPALFVAMGHDSKLAHGCAAHGGNPKLALEEVERQAKRVQEVYKPEDLYVLYGMMNTDDMSEMLIFPDGTKIDSAESIRELDSETEPLFQPSDIFQNGFLDRSLDDDATDRYVKHLPPRKFLEGTEAPMYRDLQTALAMETYLLREIVRIRKNGHEQNHLLQPRVLENILKKLDSVVGLPDSLKGPLLYQIVWNIAYALYKRRRLETMTVEERERQLEHAEELVCYGEGFELLSRNKCILVKTGRGNDEEALIVAKNVLSDNRTKKAQEHPPLVHINVEVTGELPHWDAFNEQVLSKIKTMLMPVRNVFGEDVRMLTTYSYLNEKKFYPVKLQDEEEESIQESYPIDITRQLVDSSFTSAELERRENAYSQYMLTEISHA